MANFDTGFDVTSDGNSDISDFVGFPEEDLVDNISVVQDSYPNYSDIEVSSVESMDISDFRESGDGTMNSDVDVNVPQEIVWTLVFCQCMPGQCLHPVCKNINQVNKEVCTS